MPPGLLLLHMAVRITIHPAGLSRATSIRTSQGKGRVMRIEKLANHRLSINRTADLYPASTGRLAAVARFCFDWRAIVVGAMIGLQAGCNATPFQSAQGVGAKPFFTTGRRMEKDPVGESGWPARLPSADSDANAQYHEVRTGETLQSLSTLYGLTVPQLLNANGLDAADGLKPGQLLYIPRAP